jgi:ABC-type oligopeptide transport system substrate-binding subunit/DNA-binding SARP family transcriptional activator
MPGLRMSFLGSPTLECDGVPLHFDSRKIVALVAYLAVTGESHRRESLVTLLWPELDPSRGRAGLRRNLSVLKKALAGEWLIVDRESVGSDPRADCWIDVNEFRRLVLAWREHDHPESDLCPDCLTNLAEAVELYRGDFLEGFSLRDSPNFDDWQFFQTESLRQDLAAALELLVRGHSAQRTYERAILYARRWLALDPLHEPAHRYLMRLYAWSGQWAAAIRQYGECERLLQKELDVLPAEETNQLYKTIKEKRRLPPPGDQFVMPPEEGVLNNRYRLGAELGRGSMGVVYRAHDLLLDRDVAVKVYSSADLDSRGRARLMDEARAAAKLNHPNIVSVYDAGETDPSLGSGQPLSFIVTEFVEGQSLYDCRPDTLDDILAIARQVCLALEHAHIHGMVHRDLKPENIIITSDGTAKLTDFGLARPVASRITNVGAIVGTVFYLAPEIALGQKFDGRADLYALGVMLYELTTGCLPFTADNPMAVVSQHLQAPVVPPRARNAEIPPALDTLILRLMNKDQGKRPGSATEVLQILDSPDMIDLQAAPEEELWVLNRIRRGRLVGRDQELRQARALWDRALSGNGQMLLVSGEAGIGKTRLVRELAAQIQILGSGVFVGACYAEGGVPYAPFAQILRQAFETFSVNDLDIPDFVLAGIQALAPASRLRFAATRSESPLDDPRTEQQLMFENLVIFFSTLSDRTSLLLVVEDVHWADSGTLSLLRHLARFTRQRRLMIVATAREVRPEEARLFYEMLLDLNRERLVTQLRLPRLNRELTKQMLALLFAEEITPDFADGIYSETEGNPFFIEEVCKALVESGKLYFTDGRWDRPSIEEMGIPQSVQVAIQSRVRVLPADAQEMLYMAAVLGREFGFDTLLEASKMDKEVLVDALEDALQAQLIEEVSRQAGGTFAFVHALIPTTLVESTRARQRRRLHRQAAVAIEAHRPDDFEALAHHYTQAVDLEKSAIYLIQVGDRARRLYAHHEAINSYRQALEFLEDTGDQEQIARTLMKLGLTYQNAFDYKASRQVYQRGLALWQQVVGTAATDLPAPHALRISTLEPVGLGPGIAMDHPVAIIHDQLFSGLVELSPGMSVIPDAAKSWEVLDGGSRYIFHLRDNLCWSDGIPLTAADFEYGWKRVLNPVRNWPAAKLLYDIKNARDYNQGDLADPDLVGVYALDELTLVVELEGPTNFFPYLLALSPLFPIPQHVAAIYGDAWPDPDHIVTNGPFRLAAWKRGQSMTLERNPTYHGRFTGNLQRVDCSFLSGQPARLLQMYEEDLLDIGSDLSPAEWIGARHRYAGEYISGPRLSIDFIGFDVSRSPFDDVRVRRAFALATDREAVADVALSGYAFPATGGLVPPGMPGHSPGIGLPYDPEHASRLLAEAGYPDGLGFPVIDCLARDDPGHDLISEFLYTQWSEILGVQIAWEEIEWGMFPNRWLNDTPHMWMTGWWADYPDPDDYLRILYWRSPAWQDPIYNRLVKRARRATDQQERMELYRQADLTLIEEVPLLPLTYLRFHMLVKPWVKRYHTSPLRWWFWKDVIIEPH